MCSDTGMPSVRYEIQKYAFQFLLNTSVSIICIKIVMNIHEWNFLYAMYLECERLCFLHSYTNLSNSVSEIKKIIRLDIFLAISRIHWGNKEKFAALGTVNSY